MLFAITSRDAAHLELLQVSILGEVERDVWREAEGLHEHLRQVQPTAEQHEVVGLLGGGRILLAPGRREEDAVCTLGRPSETPTGQSECEVGGCLPHKVALHNTAVAIAIDLHIVQGELCSCLIDLAADCVGASETELDQVATDPAKGVDNDRPVVLDV